MHEDHFWCTAGPLEFEKSRCKLHELDGQKEGMMRESDNLEFESQNYIKTVFSYCINGKLLGCIFLGVPSPTATDVLIVPYFSLSL